ncbi:MAG: hypothetical protein P4L99_24010 [Chthoniobacter sp.]|nr:hypothetical protein [Chthoniobacter sp.]
MQTLVLRIPDDLAAEIEAEARRLNSTKSEVARARLTAARGSTGEPGSGFDLISDLVGAETGGPSDVSARKKHYLKAKGYGREKPRR